MARIFVSHSSRDNALAADIKGWLESRGFEQTFLDFDKHSGIPAGADWEKTLYREIERAQAVIVIVTDNWLDSKWCFAEFTQARALGKAIFPLIVAPTGERMVGEDLQNIDLMSDRQGGLDRLSRRLVEIALQSPAGFDLPKGLSPFPGLNAFQEQHAAVFFGRDAEIARAIERLRARKNNGGAKLILLLGASGSGKSSLLQAGLVPRLKRDKETWLVLPTFRPGTAPRDKLVDCLLAGLRNDDSKAVGELDDQRKIWRTALETSEPGPALREIARALGRQSGVLEAQIVIPIDQAEEAFSIADSSSRAAFFSLLSSVLDNALPFVAVAALRSDYLGQLQSETELASPYEIFPLDQMPVDRIGTLVRDPARIANIKVEDALVIALMRDAQTTDALPLVAATLAELYERHGKDGSLTLADYESLGARSEGLSPLENIVRKRAEEAISLHRRTAENEKALRDAFVPGLVRITEAGDFVRHAARLDSLPKPSHAQIESLVGARLLVYRTAADMRPGVSGASDTFVEVAHEALFRVWPRLAGWLEEEREFLVGKGRLETYLADWQKLPDRQKPKALLTGIMLDRAKDWLAQYPGRFNPDENHFIAVSHAADTAEAMGKARMRNSLTAMLVATIVYLNRALEQNQAALNTTNVELEKNQTALESTNSKLKENQAALETSNRELKENQAALKETNKKLEDNQSTLEATNVKLAGETEKAKDALRKAEAANDELSIQLSESMEGSDEQRLEIYENRLSDMREMASKAPDNVVLQRRLSLALDNTADLLSKTDRNKAQARYEESLVISRRIVSLAPEEVLYQRDLWWSLKHVADTVVAADATRSVGLYRKGVNVLRSIVDKDPNNPDPLSDLSSGLIDLATLVQARSPADALTLYRERLEVDRRFSALAPNDTPGLQRLALTTGRLAALLQSNEPGNAKPLYEESHKAARLARAAKPNDSYTLDILGYFLNQHALLIDSTDRPAALAMYEEALAIYRKRYSENPKDLDAAGDLSVSLMHIASFLDNSDDAGAQQKALQLFKESLAVNVDVARSSSASISDRRRHAFVEFRIANLISATNPDEAKELYSDSIRRSREIMSEYPDDDDWRDKLAYTLGKLGDLLAASDQTTAEKHYEEALTVRRQIAANSPDSREARTDVADALQELGDLLAESKPEISEKYYDERQEILRKLDEEATKNK